MGVDSNRASAPVGVFCGRQSCRALWSAAAVVSAWLKGHRGGCQQRFLETPGFYSARVQVIDDFVDGVVMYLLNGAKWGCRSPQTLCIGKVSNGLGEDHNGNRLKVVGKSLERISVFL